MKNNLTLRIQEESRNSKTQRVQKHMVINRSSGSVESCAWSIRQLYSWSYDLKNNLIFIIQEK